MELILQTAGSEKTWLFKTMLPSSEQRSLYLSSTSQNWRVEPPASLNFSPIAGDKNQILWIALRHYKNVLRLQSLELLQDTSEPSLCSDDREPVRLKSLGYFDLSYRQMLLATLDPNTGDSSLLSLSLLARLLISAQNFLNPNSSLGLYLSRWLREVSALLSTRDETSSSSSQSALTGSHPISSLYRGIPLVVSRVAG